MPSLSTNQRSVILPFIDKAINRLWQFFDNFDIFSANAIEEKKNCYD